MKLPFLILILAVTSAFATPKHVTTPSKGSVADQTLALVGLLQEQLKGAKENNGTLQDKLTLSLAANDGLAGTVSGLESQITTLANDRDLAWKTSAKETTRADKAETRLSHVLNKVLLVATIVGFLFAGLTVLAILKFLGTAAWLSGPYGLYIQIAAAVAAFGAGFGAVELFFQR